MKTKFRTRLFPHSLNFLKSVLTLILACPDFRQEQYIFAQMSTLHLPKCRLCKKKSPKCIFPYLWVHAEHEPVLRPVPPVEAAAVGEGGREVGTGKWIKRHTVFPSPWFFFIFSPPPFPLQSIASPRQRLKAAAKSGPNGSLDVGHGCRLPFFFPLFRLYVEIIRTNTGTRFHVAGNFKTLL